MFSFYGEVTHTVPCVICDASTRVLFANRTAHGEPLTARWINEGRAGLDSAHLKVLDDFFKSEPFSIAKLVIHSKGKPHTLLADRQTVCGMTVYVFALIRSADSEKDLLPEESDGRRMLAACFWSSEGNAAATGYLNSEAVSIWSDIASSAARRSGKSLALSCRVGNTGCAVKGANAFLSCAAAILAAYCGNAKDNIKVSVTADRFGAYMTFSAKMLTELPTSLTACGEAAMLSACFAGSSVPMLIALQNAQGCGFCITADTRPAGELTVTLRSECLDLGDVGFKAPADYAGNTVTAIYAATELLI